MFYEKYSFPTPIAKSASNSYTILSTRGGTYKGNFTLSGNITVGGKLTANGAIIVDTDSYGYKDPNTAGPDGDALSGEVG